MSEATEKSGRRPRPRKLQREHNSNQIPSTGTTTEHTPSQSFQPLSLCHLVSLLLCFLCQTQHSLDSRPSSVSSMSSVSWANNKSASTTPVPGIVPPSGRRGKLIYTPMILVDEATGISQQLWNDGSASLPVGNRPGWYPGQTRTFTSMRTPPVNQGFVDRGSADSLVESVSNHGAGDLCGCKPINLYMNVISDFEPFSVMV